MQCAYTNTLLTRSKITYLNQKLSTNTTQCKIKTSHFFSLKIRSLIVQNEPRNDPEYDAKLFEVSTNWY